MNRRTFVLGAGQVLCLATLAPKTFFAQNSPLAHETPLAALYQRAIVIDALCSPVNDDTLPLSKTVLDQVAASGITAINHTVSGETYEKTIDAIAFACALADTYPDRWLIVRRHSDIERAKHERKTGIMLGFQYTAPFDSDLHRVETFRRLGVRIIQLTYNKRSLLGDGCLEPENAGLSDRGREAVHQMNDLGIAVDLSHCGYRTTAEAIQVSKKPVLITHSGCTAVFQHPRNKNDEDLRALVARGGVLGIYCMPYLCASPKVPDTGDVMAHLDHALNVCGEDHVGIGSDASIQPVDDSPETRKRFAEDIARRKQLGIGAPGEDRFPYVPDLNSPHRMELIAAAMKKRGHNDRVIEKVLGANFHRALGDIWGTT